MMNTAAALSPSASDIAKHMTLVHRIVAQFVRRLPRSVQREDLVSAGTVGLFHALRSSNHTCEEMFIAYARIRIRGSIVDELRRHDWAPRRRRAPDGKGLPAEGNAVVAPITVVGFDDLPLQTQGAIEAGTADGGSQPVDEELAQRKAFVQLQKGVGELPEREQAIIRMRYFEEMPSKDIAASLGLSEARVSQLHARATARLRAILANEESALEVAA